MNANAQSCVCVIYGHHQAFNVEVEVHHGSVLSPLLFIIVLGALSREFRSGALWEDLYVDQLVILTYWKNVSGDS